MSEDQLMGSRFHDYIKFTCTTAVYPEAGKGTKAARKYASYGLFNEIGEFVGKVKKFMRGDVPLTLETAREKLLPELGDICYYVTRCLYEYQNHQFAIEEVFKSPFYIDEMIFEESNLLKDIQEQLDQLSYNVDLANLISGVRVYAHDYWAEVFLFIHLVSYGLGSSLTEVMDDNTNKLADRLARDVIKGDGDNR